MPKFADDTAFFKVERMLFVETNCRVPLQDSVAG